MCGSEMATTVMSTISMNCAAPSRPECLPTARVRGGDAVRIGIGDGHVDSS